MNEKYEEHLKKCWGFAEKSTEEILQLEGNLATNIKIKIFEKCVSPYHYFLENKQQEPPPTPKQLKLAKKLGIKNPESYTKETISQKIDEVLSND